MCACRRPTLAKARKKKLPRAFCPRLSAASSSPLDITSGGKKCLSLPSPKACIASDMAPPSPACHISPCHISLCRTETLRIHPFGSNRTSKHGPRTARMRGPSLDSLARPLPSNDPAFPAPPRKVTLRNSRGNYFTEPRFVPRGLLPKLPTPHRAGSRFSSLAKSKAASGQKYRLSRKSSSINVATEKKKIDFATAGLWIHRCRRL